MTIEFDQGGYEYLLKCLKEFNKPQYCESIEKSLILDNEIFILGFKKHPTYTVDVNISKQDIDEMLRQLNIMHKKDYAKFDGYAEFNNILTSLKSDEDEKYCAGIWPIVKR